MLLSSCQSSWGKPVPHNEIVYQASNNYTKIGLPQYQLGFIQADGENNQIVEIDRRFDKPVWSINGIFLYGLSDGKADYLGYPAYWDIDSGRFGICTNLPFYDLIQGSENAEKPHEVIIQHVWEISLFDIIQCKRVKTFVNYSEDPGGFAIAGFSYQSITQELVYGLIENPYKDRKYYIKKLDIKTGEEVTLVEGINPVWSPDGKYIAYIGLDGLYVMDASGSDRLQLVKRFFFDSKTKAGSPWSPTPIPRWSPDGEWVIYHRCNTEKICTIDEAHIYKIRSRGGPEELILVGGKYPSWRP
jgi:hypothetical protein